jgi:hypothetical protein
MRHLHDDDLVLIHYGEGDPEPAAHARTCAECQGRLSSLSAVLASVQPPATPERPADYGASVWARLQPRLDSRLVPEQAPGPADPACESILPLRASARSWRRWAGLSALAASLAMAFLLGRQFPGPAPQPLSPAVRERILLVAIGDHLERSQVVLVEIANAPADGPKDVSAERASAHDLVFANRLYRQTAARAGESALAAMLEELERVLVEVSAGPERLAPGDLAELQRRIESRGLLFKIRVVGSQVRAREKARAPSAARAS